MPLKLIAPTVKQVPLTSIDPTGDTFATFRQATMEQHQIRGQVFAERVYQWNDKEQGLVTQKSKWNPDVLMALEVWLTITDCNMHAEECKCKECTSNPETTDPVKYLFPFKRGKISQDTFDLIWGRLPSEWAGALVDACYQVNPQWSGVPKVTAELTESSES